MQSKDLSKEAMEYEKLIQFQAKLVEYIYDEPGQIFYVLCDYMKCSQIAFLLCDAKGMVTSRWYDVCKDEVQETDQLLDAMYGELFQYDKVTQWSGMEIPGSVREYALQQGDAALERVTSLGGETDKALYRMLFFYQENGKDSFAARLEGFLLQTIRNCLKKRIFYENIAYESQHDMLTKLYNRRSYFQRSQEEYPQADSIGVVYFDVNNLKKVNDQYGHDAGDALLQKAAESIRCLTGENVHGYRMGGDEFILVAVNSSLEEVKKLLARWEDELKKVNEKYGGEPCVIAAGSAYAKGSFEIEEVCSIADKRMYRDKIRKKMSETGEKPE